MNNGEREWGIIGHTGVGWLVQVPSRRKSPDQPLGVTVGAISYISGFSSCISFFLRSFQLISLITPLAHANSEPSVRSPLKPVADHIILHYLTGHLMALFTKKLNGRGQPHPEVKG